ILRTSLGEQWRKVMVPSPSSSNLETIVKACSNDDEVAEKVNKLAMAVMDSIDLMAEADPDFPNHGLVCIPHNLGNNTKQLFHVLAHKVETYRKGRSSFAINYDSKLNKFNNQAQFASKNEHLVNKKESAKQQPKLNLQLGSAPKKQEVIAKLSNIMQKRKDQNDPRLDKPEIGTSKKQMHELICMLETITYDKKSPSHLETITYDKKSPSQTEYSQLEAYSLVNTIGCQQIDNYQLEASSLVSSSVGTSEADNKQLGSLMNDETITDNEKYPLHIESQNLEVRLEENTVVKVDDK
ncbi:hypothetical protein Tco_1089234, partial [Tanacetum coccineum]